MTLLFVGMTSGEMVFAGLDPLLSKSGTCPDSNKGIFTALSAAGRRNGRWSACLVPRLIVESWQGVSIEPLKPRSLSSKLGVNKTMSPLGRPGPRSDPLLGRSSQTNGVPLHPSSSAQLPCICRCCCVKSLLQKAHLILLQRFSTRSWIAQKLRTA